MLSSSAASGEPSVHSSSASARRIKAAYIASASAVHETAAAPLDLGVAGHAE